MADPTREQFDAAAKKVAASAPPGLSKEQFYDLVDKELSTTTTSDPRLSLGANIGPRSKGGYSNIQEQPGWAEKFGAMERGIRLSPGKLTMENLGAIATSLVPSRMLGAAPPGVSRIPGKEMIQKGVQASGDVKGYGIGPMLERGKNVVRELFSPTTMIERAKAQRPPEGFERYSPNVGGAAPVTSPTSIGFRGPIGVAGEPAAVKAAAGPKTSKPQPAPNIDPTKPLDATALAREQGTRSAAGLPRKAVTDVAMGGVKPEGAMSSEEFANLRKSVMDELKTPTEKAQADKVLEEMIGSMQVTGATGARTPWESLGTGQTGEINPGMLVAGGMIGAGGAYAAKKIYDIVKQKMSEVSHKLNPYQRAADILDQSGGSSAIK